MTQPKRSIKLMPFDFVRGFLMGLVELVPGVSGGTIALVTGIYDELIASAAAFLHAAKRLVTGPNRVQGFMHELRNVQWGLLIPVFLGMVTAVFSIAGIMSSFVTNSPEHARGLFFGLVIVSIYVPVSMAYDSAVERNINTTKTWIGGAVAFVIATIIAFVLVGQAGGGAVAHPPAWIVIGAAAIAICALVIPGVSGSFFLLAVGLYTTTLEAVHQRDWGYLAIFMLGAVIGLASFVQLLQFLLKRFRLVTLMAMAGLMLGSVRALWPWQESPDPSSPGTLVAPYAPVAGPVVLMLVGGVIVVVMIVVEKFVQSPSPQPQQR